MSTRLALLIAVAAMLTVSACSSGTTSGQPSAASSSSSAAPTSASESVPPGVPKDSVLDLNSTKDMTGVVTTVSFADSPYAAHLPDVCKLIPDSIVEKLQATRRTKAFDGTQLVTQGCVIRPPLSNGSFDNFSINAAIYVNNIRELVDQPSSKIVSRKTALTSQISATVFQNMDFDLGSNSTTCRVAWGTFYGSASINYLVEKNLPQNPCQRGIAAAKLIAPYMPSKPSQMRPS